MRNTNKGVLVTGGTGFIGRHLIDRLMKNYKVVTIARDPSYKKKGVEIIYGDITDPDCVMHAMQNVDTVIHLAASLDASDKNILKTNVSSTKILVKAAENSFVRKFIFISTENVLYSFNDMYSETKKMAEKIVRTFVNHLILRPTTVYGEQDERYIKKLVGIIKKYNLVPIPGNGKKLFQPVYVDDVVKSIENGLKYDVRGEYVIAGPSKISYDEFVDALLKELDINKPIVHIPLSLLKVGNFLNKNLLRNKRFGFYQVKSLEIDKIYDIKESVKSLSYKPTPFKIGIRKAVKSLRQNR